MNALCLNVEPANKEAAVHLTNLFLANILLIGLAGESLLDSPPGLN